MSTIWFENDVDSFTSKIKEMLVKYDAELVVTTDMDGKLLAGNKAKPLRTPMAYCTDGLKVRDGIPMQAKFFGVMLLPKNYIDEQASEQEATDEP